MQTKHLFLTAILLVFSMLVVAEPVDPMRALEVAEQFAPQSAKAKRIKSKTAPEQSYEIVYTHRMPNSDRAAFYVVKLGEKGFVIISADDVANPILGYSYTNSWPTSISAEGDTLLPPQVLSYLNDMALQIETAIEEYPNLESSEEWNNVGQKAVRKTSARKSADALPDSVGPLLTTTWGQGQYYNALCPEDAEGEDGHVPTGCVATAMAQIINYWGQKEEIKTRGIHSYDCQYGNLTVNYDSTSYDFANMPDALTAESTPEQVNAVAKLMYECGVAVNMLYSTGASASLNEDARAALINFYHFTPDLSIAERAYFSNVEWDNLLHNDIAQGKPVYYSGTSNYLGHSFVCDGYNATGYYHFNFGWGGLADGWYLTSAISPIGMDFNSNQSVLVGIVPDNTSNVILGQTTGNSVFNVDEPLEFYHLLGHNAYEGTNYINECNNHVLFKSADNTTQLVLDIIEHEDQNAIIYDGEWGTELRSLYAGQENDLSPVVSTNNALHINYLGNMYYSGFRFAISKDEGCRRVSNIVTSVDTTTVHLMWQENGNATQWEIEYGEKGFALGSGTKIVTESTRYDIIGLKKFTEYDIYIRSVCSVNDYGEWSKVSILSEAPYWTDVVIEQPDGYVEDDKGILTISSAEGLAWFARLASLGIEQSKNVIISTNINLGDYKWKPIALFAGTTFDGAGHTIENINIIERTVESAGFFTYATNCVIENISLFNLLIYIHQSSWQSGGVVGSLNAHSGSTACISNCQVQLCIKNLSKNFGGHFGGIAGACDADENSNAYIVNCQARGNIFGKNGNSGGIVGLGRNAKIFNSSSTCDITSFTVGGIAGHIELGFVIENCYTGGNLVGKGSCTGSVAGTKYAGGFIHYCYFKNNDMRIFGHAEGYLDTLNIIPMKLQNKEWMLCTPVIIDQQSYSNLTDVMNIGVKQINEPYLRMWKRTNTNNAFPIIGEEYIVSCPNTSIPKLRNIVQGDSIGVVVNWKEYGDAPQWQIRYRVRDSINYTIHTTNHNPDTIWNLQFGECYNFNIRPICDDLHHGAWTDNVIHTVTTPYWTEMVTSKPEGFIIDSIGNIIISSAEGLAWLASVVNGLNGEKANKLAHRTVCLKADMDMSKLRWAAIDGFQGKFDGGGHMIYGITIDEQSSNQGFFGSIENSQIINVNIQNAKISAVDNVGGLCGLVLQSSIHNCNVEGWICGSNYAGGLIGDLVNSSVHYCSAEGLVNASNHTAGGLIGEVRTYSYIDEYTTDLNASISNCFSTSKVWSSNSAAGGLIGAVYADHGDIVIENSFTRDSVSGMAYVGGFIGYIRALYFHKGTVRNCCSYNNVNANPFITNSAFPNEYINGAFIGQCEGNIAVSKCYVKELPIFSFFGSHHGSQDYFTMKDTSFITSDGVTSQLKTPITINGITHNNSVSALNEWINLIADDSYYTWRDDTSEEYAGWPILRELYNKNCPSVTSLQVDSIWNNGVKLKWHNDNDVNTWKIEYGLSGFERGEGCVIYVSDTIITVDSLTTGDYYDFYIQSCCNECLLGKSDSITLKPDKKYWVDIVTSKPNGYEEDTNGNIYISSPEGLAWLISTCNGYNGQERNSFDYKTIYLMKDIDISNYKWTTLDYFNGTFNGLHHTINGLYINENMDRIAMIGHLEGVIKNIVLRNGEINGNYYVAALCVENEGLIENCGVSCNITSRKRSGILVAENRGLINNSYTVGQIYGTDYVGGSIGFNYGNGKIKNCYAASVVKSSMMSNYIVTSVSIHQFTGNDYPGDPNNIAYWFYSPYNKENSITAAPTDLGYHSFIGNDSCWYLSSPQIIDGIPYTTLVDALNAWVDANNSEGQYLHWVADTAGVNGGFPIFAEEDTRYIITFCNDDGTILQQDTLELGEMPEYRGGIPTKDSTEQYNYTFIGWGQEVVPVTKDVTYYAQYEETINQYEINFYDWDGTLLQSTMVNYGEWPTYYNSDPWRESDAQYTYTFTGWSPELSMVTGAASYYAQYEATLNQYEVTFLNWDGTLLQSEWVNYGEWPAYYNSDPWREADAQYTYTFIGWNPELSIVTSHQSYYAQYESTLNQYEINFYDWDGSLLYSEMFDYGEYPVYGEPANPEREADAQYTYTFIGWSPELDWVSGHQSYYAQYEATINQYEINFYNWDGTLLQSSMVNYGEWPAYYNSDPWRDADAQYSYTFTGWSPQLDIVTGHQSYYAQYESTLNQYEISFYNWDGTLLQSEWVNYGDMPVYTGVTPTREPDAQYTYTFTGWSPELDMVTGHQSYYAQYDATLNQYEITFYDWDGTLLQSSMVNYGEMPTYTGVTPTRESDAQYTYTFTGWSPQLDWVTGHQSYYAQYETTLNQYEINFYNWDGTLLQSSMVNYGEWPAYYNSDPWREADAQYTYTFTGWNPQLDWVTSNQSYYAQYESTLNQYEINFYDWDGTLLQSTMVNYGEWPTYYNSDPWREADAQYTYTFIGWSPELSMVTGHQSYYAQYESTLNQYEINFYNWDGTLLQSTMVNYGEWPAYYNSEPTREADAQYTYNFTGWSPQLDIVTGHQSYYAQYESTLNQYEINFYDWDGTLLYSGWDYYGDYPFYGGVTPTREADAQYSYTFTGWSPELSMVTGNQSYYAQYEETLNQYEINFYDWDGTLLQSELVNYGEWPAYYNSDPWRESNAQYTYTFSGWSPQLDWVTGAANYYAQYESTLNQYEITFYDWDGTLLYSGWDYYGDYPFYGGVTPTRESDAQYTYTFTGWSPELDWVTGAANYYAQYESTLNQYEINFYNWDGTLLQSSMVNYGEWPAYYNSDPWREADAQYTYTFTGWSPELSMVTGHQSYYAQYESTLNQYEINFYNWDGTLLQSAWYNYGEYPSYNGETPTHEADAQYTYTFSGWSPQLDIVTGHQSYYAQYESTLNQYEITFYNWDGTLLQSSMVNYGEWPTYYNSDPWREADAQYTYTFIGWSPELDMVTSHQSYYAQYESTLNQYEINFYNWDGTLLQSSMVNYGEWPTYYNSDPWREADAQYTYTFTGWSPQLDIVTGHQSYYAQYESTLNQYEINFYDWDGTLLQSNMVNYGEWPNYYNSEPTREADAQYTYTFTGWSPQLDIVTGHQSYYAQYESTLNQYEINFYNWNGTLLQSSMVNYGEWPTYYNSEPTREADAQYTYNFTGWSPQLDWVTGHQSYYAQYEATLNQYEITFLNWDGEVLQSTMVDYGAMPEYFGVTPTKPEDDQYVYTFSGWEPEITIVVAYAEYTAQYDATDKVTTVIENTQSDEVKTYKILRNNKIFIIRGDKVYSILGHVIEDWMPLEL